MLDIINIGKVQIEFAWPTESLTIDFDKIDLTLKQCAEKSERIGLDTLVSNTKSQKSITVLPYKKLHEPNGGVEEKEIEVLIFYDTLLLSFIEFFAYHGDQYLNFAGTSTE